jgi:hypothetical protein
LLLAIACSENPSEPTTSSIAPPSGQDERQPPDARPLGIDLQAIDRFDIDLQATGRFRPGERIEIVARVRANLPTTAAAVRLVLPEVAAGGVARLGQLPVGVSLPSVLQETRAMSQGQEVVRHASIVIPDPGFYRVILSVRKVSVEPDLSSRRAVQDVAFREAWLLIDERGGRLTSTFDPSLLPANVIPTPGPRRLSAAGAAVTACSSWQVVYLNMDAAGGLGAYEPITGAFVKGFIGKLLFSTSTDASGHFSVCANTSYNGSVYLANADVNVNDSPIVRFSGSASTTGGTLAATSSSAARVYVNLMSTIPASRALLGYSRGQMAVAVLTTTGTSSYGSDKITITSNAVWGSYGIFTAAHEYGHAVHEKALNGNAASGNCPGSGHTIDGSYDMRCAYSEGFADFHAFATRGSALVATFYSDYNVERNYYYSLGSTYDGSTIEGAVAAFFYDLIDGPSSPDGANNETNGDDDGVQFPGRYVADIIRTCQVQVIPFKGVRAIAIDQLIYCFENTVDPAIANSSFYFPHKINQVTQEFEGATEPSGWSKSVIRALWTRDLYGQ